MEIRMLPFVGCLGALALELRPGATPARDALAQAAAGELAAGIAADLARLVPEAATLDLGLAAALFDPVELLRPGWPLHTALTHLLAQAPAGSGEARVIALGTHDGAMPPGLQPEPEYAGGALRLLPLLVRGDADTERAVGDAFERLLLEQGMAGAGTALRAQEAFGVAIEHARYLTVHDLAAMMAMQYEHAGLAAAWPLLESALLGDGGDAAWLDAPPEPLVRVAAGEARIALFDDTAWAGSAWAPATLHADPSRADALFSRFQMRQRQLAALLEAHAVPVTFVHCPPGIDPRAALVAD
jgi:hypothetical protein